MKIKESHYPWADRFIEIVVRSLLKIHRDYQIWNIGCSGVRDDNNRLMFNNAYGIELASEEQVCSLIAQDAINSSLFSGAIIEENTKYEIEKGIRFWIIDRERNYSYNTEKRMDLYINRYNLNQDTLKIDSDQPYVPACIEAKRVRIYTVKNLKDIKIKKLSRQFKSIRDDIVKLQKENEKNEIHGHLLLWSIYRHNVNGSLKPNEFLERFEDKYKDDLTGIDIVLHKTRWIPLEWTNYKSLDKSPDDIKKSLWVSLVELKFNK